MLSMTMIENLKQQFNEEITFLTFRKFVIFLVQKLKILCKQTNFVVRHNFCELQIS